MISRFDLVTYLDRYLAAQSILDYAPNGLQIEGCVEIRKLCTAVSISQSVIQAAIQWQADAILVHHGFFWRGERLVLTQLLPVTNVSQHDVEKLPKGLWAGELLEPLSPQDLSSLLQQIFGQAPIHISASGPKIQRIAWCTGAAQDFLEDAQHLGVDAFISGEISERTYDLAQELNVHYYACGHHATERYGVQALAMHLEQQFGIEHLFIDSNNPI